MKKIEAIIQPAMLEDVKVALLKINVRGITISQVMGCGKQMGRKEYYRGSEVNLNVLPKIKIEIVVVDSLYEKAIQTIMENARTGDFGDGKIFVTTIHDVFRIRTGESGEAALQ